MDYYQILQVDRKASKEELKKAYKRLSRKFHPDNAGEEGREKLEQVQKAYEILGDEAKREAYDCEHIRNKQKKNDQTRTETVKEEQSNYQDLQGFYQGSYKINFESFFGFSTKSQQSQKKSATQIDAQQLFQAFFGKTGK